MSLNSIIEYTESQMTIPPKTSSDLLPDNHVNKLHHVNRMFNLFSCFIILYMLQLWLFVCGGYSQITTIQLSLAVELSWQSFNSK